MQTPSGMETPSGMASVVSTVAGGLETPDFLELRKGRAAPEPSDSGPRSLYQVVPEKQTSIRGLMGSERGYDVSAVSSAPIPVLGDERGTKVRIKYFSTIVLETLLIKPSEKQMGSMFLLMRQSWRVCRRRNSVASTMLILVEMLAYLEVVARTSRTW